MIKRISWLMVVTFLLGSLYLAGNLFYGFTDALTRESDLRFLANKCDAIPAQDRLNLSAHVILDRSFDGTLYIYDGSPIPGGIPAFEAAWRGPVSELFCVPKVGCLFAPVLSDQCAAGVE